MIEVKIKNDIDWLRDKSLPSGTNIDSIKTQKWIKKVYLFGIRIYKYNIDHGYTYDHKEVSGNRTGFVK